MRSATTTNDPLAGCIAIPFACLLAVASTGCRDEPPGAAMGSYQVEGRLLENECGQTGEHFRSSFSFQVELRHDGDMGYWVSGSHRPVPGKLDRTDGRFDFQLEQQLMPDAPGMTNETSCVLLQQERIQGTLEDVPSERHADTPMTDAGMSNPPGRFNADNRIQLAPVPGADCSRALAPAGPFAELPCTARYELEGTRVDP